ncbi:Small heat shock protein HSP [Parasponia andersonii]|uniref:Small heat shock protein HSP n=1 Tax=Parasponia andersonii TaxID=3476 RepID=A0A2P5B5J2_PARAD|nr:Small heat shock protein HSP [Parasponia andersonii]
MSLIPQLFGGEILDPFLSLINKCPVLNTPTDWKETPNDHIFVADLPGLSKDDVKVEVVEGRVLEISGERKNVDDDVEKNDRSSDGGSSSSTTNTTTHDTWHRVERCQGKFHRRFKLPENAKVDEVKASMENGVLTVTIPKREVKKPERKLVQIE